MNNDLNRPRLWDDISNVYHRDIIELARKQTPYTVTLYVETDEQSELINKWAESTGIKLFADYRSNQNGVDCSVIYRFNNQEDATMFKLAHGGRQEGPNDNIR